MDYFRNLSKTLYHHHFIRYLLIGGTTFVIENFLLLAFKAKLGLVVATSIGYWVSILYNFTMNRWWSFSATEKNSLRRHALTYGALLAFNYLFLTIFVKLVSRAMYFGGNHTFNIEVANVLAVLIQVSWTYVIYKNYIFAKKEQSDTI
jgi:putative flippase GtrA